MLGNLRFLLTCALAYLTLPADWRPLDPNNTLYVELLAGRIDLCNVPIAVHEPAPIAPQSP
jgi:hypothetical protein